MDTLTLLKIWTGVMVGASLLLGATIGLIAYLRNLWGVEAPTPDVLKRVSWDGKIPEHIKDTTQRLQGR